MGSREAGPWDRTLCLKTQTLPFRKVEQSLKSSWVSGEITLKMFISFNLQYKSKFVYIILDNSQETPIACHKTIKKHRQCPCSGFDLNGPQRLIHLKVSFPVSRSAWKGLRGCGLDGGCMSLAWDHVHHDVSSQPHACPPACHHASCHIGHRLTL